MAPLSASGRGLRGILVISCNRLLKGLNQIKLPLIRGIHQNSPSTSSTPAPHIFESHILYSYSKYFIPLPSNHSLNPLQTWQPWT